MNLKKKNFKAIEKMKYKIEVVNENRSLNYLEFLFLGELNEECIKNIPFKSCFKCKKLQKAGDFLPMIIFNIGTLFSVPDSCESFSIIIDNLDSNFFMFPTLFHCP